MFKTILLPIDLQHASSWDQALPMARRLLAADPGITMSVSVTTRTPRPGEVDGVDYIFADKARFEAMSAQYRRLDYFSAKAGTLGSVLFGDAHPARPDADGRIVLPEDLIQDGELTEAVSIVGHDEIFQIWDTDRHIAFRREQRQRAREEALTLPSARPEGGAP